MHDNYSEYRLAFKNEAAAVKELSKHFGINDDSELNTSGFGFVVDMVGHEPHRTGEFDEDGNEITKPREEYLVNVRTQDPHAELEKINRVVKTPVREFQ